MVKNKEEFEQEVYRLVSTRKEQNFKEIDGIGINFDRESRKHRVSVTFLDESTLVGEELESKDTAEIMQMFTAVSETIFEDNGVLLEPAGE